MPQAEYETLAKNVKAVRLWQSIGPKWPQIAVLELSGAEYKKFLKNPKSYLNGLNFFGKKLTRKVFCCRFARINPKKPQAQYVVIVKHEIDCTSVSSSSSAVKL
jgi:hypothetical protein